PTSFLCLRSLRRSVFGIRGDAARHGRRRHWPRRGDRRVVWRPRSPHSHRRLLPRDLHREGLGVLFFWAKIGTFMVIGLLSVPPTLAFLKRRRAGASPADEAVARARRYLWMEVALFPLLPASPRRWLAVMACSDGPSRDERSNHTISFA